jgi:hypothetical protein
MIEKSELANNLDIHLRSGRTHYIAMLEQA